MPSVRLFTKKGQIRFSVYGKTHYVSSVNDRGNARLTADIGEYVDVELETPDYVNDSKSMVGDVPCFVEHVVSPYWDKPSVTLTEPTALTFELLYTSQEHDEFPLPDGSLVFDDKGLKIYCHFGLRRRFEYKESILDLRSGVVDGKLEVITDVKEGSIRSMMELVESTDLGWSSMQDWIEQTEDFAVEYMESFGEYVINTYVDGVPF